VQLTVATTHVQPVPVIAVVVRLAGNVSMTVTVPAVGPGPMLFAVNVYVAPVSPRPKLPVWLLVIVRSGARTLIEAVAVLPVPPFTALTFTVVFTLFPAMVAVTFTANVQEALTAMAPPVSVTLPEPPTAVTVPLPHVPEIPFGVATTSPAGSVSVKATPVSATAEFGLVMVKLRAVEPARPIETALNDFVMDGEAATVIFAVDALPVPPLVEVTVPVVFV